MTINDKFKALTIVLFISIASINCKNHIDKYNVQLDSFEKLPDNFYAYRGGGVYFEDLKVEDYRIFFKLGSNGNVQNIFRIDDVKNRSNNLEGVMNRYAIDTSMSKVYAQTFIDLSRKYKFGHLLIDKANRVSFSYIDGLGEQYVRTLNDSVKNVYLKDDNFKLLKNGWFENVAY